MNTWKLITIIVILVSPFLIGAYGLVAYLVAGNEATISRACLNTSIKYPFLTVVVCYLFGVLCGHLFVPQHVSP